MSGLREILCRYCSPDRLRVYPEIPAFPTSKRAISAAII
jgi:hypothetical protein